VLGRSFMPHEGDAGSHRVAILTHALWTRHYGADPAIVGRTASINGQPYQVIGVFPRGFAYPSEDYELMTPLVVRGAASGMPPINRGARYLRVVGRLAEGATEETARRELDVIGRRLQDAYRDTNETVTIGMLPLAADTIGDAGSTLVVVLIAVGVVLLIACVNVAGLSIARGSARSRELAVRAAIGASRGRLVRQLATETFVLFVLGGLTGVILAAWAVHALASELPRSIPRVADIAVDWRVALFGVVVTLAAGMISSLLPALSIARRGPWSDIASARGAVSAARSTQRTRGLLIVAQIAAAVVLLSGAALAIKSFDRVRRADTGFDAARALTFSFVLRDQGYPGADDLRAFTSRVSETLNATSGIEAAGLTTALPLSDQNIENSFTVDGSPPEDGQDPPIAGVRGVIGNYRAAIGARVMQGRDLQPGDTAQAPLVAVVTADFAKRYVRTPNPIGARLKLGGADSDDPWRTIVGVIADIRHAALDEAPRPEVWLPYAQMHDELLTRWLRGIYAAARTSIEPASAAPPVRAAMRALDPSLPLRDVQPMSDLARASTAERRLETSLLAGFGLLALVLAAVGLFGVLAFHVAQHMQEFGVRLALGATPRALLGLVIGRGMLLLAVGVALGLPGALAMGRGMSTLLYGVEPTDPVALGGAVLVLSVVTLAACALPARRAMRTDPLIALRRD
jgi:putative ABC transport system permease protein